MCVCVCVCMCVLYVCICSHASTHKFTVWQPELGGTAHFLLVDHKHQQAAVQVYLLNSCTNSEQKDPYNVIIILTSSQHSHFQDAMTPAFVVILYIIQCGSVPSHTNTRLSSFGCVHLHCW